MSQHINLIDPTLLPPHDWCTGWHLLALTLLLGVGVSAHAIHAQRSLQHLLSASLAAPAAPAPTDDETTTRLALLQQQVQRNRALLEAVNDLTDLPRDTARRLTTLTAALPPTVWLREVTFAGARGVRIAGGTLQPSALAALSEQLGQTEPFRDQPLRVFSLAPLLPTAEAPAGNPAAFGFVLSSMDEAGGRTP